MAEYAERRASILGQNATSSSPQCAPSVPRLAGRKRRRGQWDAWPVQPRRLPNASVLDVIHEIQEEDEDEEECYAPNKRLRTSNDEDKLMDVRTMVFGMGANGDLCVGYAFHTFLGWIIHSSQCFVYRYKYLPNLLQELLFPSPRSSAPDAPSARKRRRIQPNESNDVEMADADSLNSSGVTDDSAEPPRPIILETAKERYLLSPSVLPKPATPTSPVSSQSVKQLIMYDIGLVLEAEVVVEEEAVPNDTTASGAGSVVTGSEQPESAIEKEENETRADQDTQAKAIDVSEDVVMTDSADVADIVGSLTVPEGQPSDNTDAEKPSDSSKAPTGDSTEPQAPVRPTSPPKEGDENTEPQLRADNGGADPIQTPSEPLPTSPVTPSEPISQPDSTTPALHLIPKPFAPTPLPTVPPPHLSSHSRHRHTFSTATVVLIDEETGLEIEPAKPQFAVQMLQTNLTKGMFRFAEDGVYVRDDVVMMNGAEGGEEEVPSEWVIQVKNWKWAPKNARAVIN